MATMPRYFFGVLPRPDESEQWLTRLAAAGVASKLGRRMFAMANWHQTLSGRHFDADDTTIARLLQAGARINASAVTLRFNRVIWTQGEPERRNHCTLFTQGRPVEFDALLGAVQAALAEVGLGDSEGHRPHITLSYDAGELHPTVQLIPIEWSIDEVLLLKGHGNPYRYDVIGRWPLLPPASPQHQVDLFALG
ncbi:MAG: hypothetical protein IAE66_00600 [Xanthomonadaceae bacterium]|nr:hypothetical protein [Xanthomonadaceae bacterium]